MKNKTLTKFILVITTIVIFLFISLYIIFNTYLPKIVVSQLESYGFENVVVESGRPGLFQLIIPKVKFKHPSLGNSKMEFVLKNLFFKYSYNSLINKEIEGIDIESAILKIKLDPKKDKKEFISISEKLPLASSFPFKSFILKKIFLELDINEDSYKLDGKLNIVNNKKLLAGNFVLKPLNNFTFIKDFKINLILDNREISSRLNISTDSLNLIPKSQSTIRAKLINDLLTISGDIDFLSEKEVSSELNLEFNLKNGKGQLLIKTLDSDQGNLRFFLERIIQEKIPFPLVFTEGKVGGQLFLAFLESKITENTLSLNVDNLSGVVNKLIFSNLTSKHTFNLQDGFNSKSPSLIKVGKLTFGPHVDNMSSMISFITNKDKQFSIRLNNLKAEVFDGKVLSPQINYTPTFKENKFDIELKSLNLKKILEAYPQKNISANGIIDAKLPLSLSKNNLSILNGELTAQSPGGVIKYQSKDTIGRVENNSQLKFASKVLENFHYNYLSSGITLSPDGNMALDLKINGKNPEMNINQDVNVKLNIEENLPALFKSLRILSGLENKIQKILEDK